MSLFLREKTESILTVTILLFGIRILLGTGFGNFDFSMVAIDPIDPRSQLAQVGGSSQLAFPGAEGFGRFAKGGRGGQILFVDNLNDSGPGSFRAAVTASGPRTVVFRVGGTIPLQSEIRVTNPYLTIAGQTAPGGGITLKNAGTIRGRFFSVLTHNVIVRYIRFRPGPNTDGHPNGSNIDGFNISTGSHDVIFDHVSVSWATDENTSVFADARDVTIQWSIIGEGLYCSTHYETVNPPAGQTEEPAFTCPNGGVPGSKGLLVANYDGDPDTLSDDLHPDRISVHHNLFAHNLRRQPQMTSRSLVDVVNNVVYDHGQRAMSSKRSGYNTRINLVNNYIKAGPSSDFSQTEPKFGLSLLGNVVSEVWVTNGFIGPSAVYIYESGNVTPSPMQGMVPTHWTTDAWRSPSRFSAPSVTETSAQEAYNQVLAGAGVTLPIRDAVDNHIIADVQNGTGRKVNDPSDVGGWPQLALGSPPSDSDNDGMPNAWEVARGFSANTNESAQDADGDGYTNIEEYLNYLINPSSFPESTGVGQVIPPPPPDPQPEPQPQQEEPQPEPEPQQPEPQPQPQTPPASQPQAQDAQEPYTPPTFTEFRETVKNIFESNENNPEGVSVFNEIKKQIIHIPITYETSLSGSFVAGLRSIFNVPTLIATFILSVLILIGINMEKKWLLVIVLIASLSFVFSDVGNSVLAVSPPAVTTTASAGVLALLLAFYGGLLTPILSFSISGMLFSRDMALGVMLVEIAILVFVMFAISSGLGSVL